MLATHDNYDLYNQCQCKESRSHRQLNLPVNTAVIPNATSMKVGFVGENMTIFLFYSKT